MSESDLEFDAASDAASDAINDAINDAISDVDEDIVQEMNDAETRLAAELSAFLEDEMGVDSRRFRISVRAAVVHIQGTLESRQQLRDCLELLASRPGVSAVDSSLQVQESLAD